MGGFEMFDTAAVYNNQVGVGRALQGVPRDSYFLMTKVPGCGTAKSVRMGHCYEDTKAVLEENLRQLNMSYVDAVIVHSPPQPTMLVRTCKVLACPEISNQWRAMQEFYAEKKTRVVGVSNYCDSCFKCLDNATVQPMVNQIMYNFGMGDIQKTKDEIT